MTTEEFSNTFDTLLNSYASQAQFGEQASKQEIVLDEYEKSVLLTQAQDIVVKQFFQRTSVNEGFDDSTRRQVDFSNLITVASPTVSSETTHFDARGKMYKMPDDLLFMLNEVLTVGNKNYIVVPINYKEYDRQMSKPYAQPLKKQAWRLFQGDDVDVLSEVIPIVGINLSNATYKIRYVRRPSPIIVADLTATGLDVDGETQVSQCEVNPILHMDILNKAVELALTTRGAMRPRETSNKE